MAAGHDDDARRTLAELEAKLRELERELLRGRDPGAPPPPEAPQPAAAPEPTAEGEPLRQPAAAAEPVPELGPPAEAQPRAAEPEPEPLAAEPFPEPPAAEPEPPDAEPFPEPIAAEPDHLAAFAPDDTAAPQGDPLAAHPAPGEPGPHAAEPDALAPAPDDTAAPHGDPLAAQAAAPTEPPAPALDLDALADAHGVLDDLRATIEAMGATAGRITVAAHAVVDDHGRSLARLALAARAAARAEEAAAEAGRVAGTVVIEAGPFADPGPLLELRDALAARPGTKDAYVRGVEDGRAVIEVHLAPPA